MNCGNCGGPDDTWLVNPKGGYGRPELWACTRCLAGEWSGMVPRLLEAYPEESAAELERALKDNG